jgi:hypothetical protein
MRKQFGDFEGENGKFDNGILAEPVDLSVEGYLTGIERGSPSEGA